MERLVIILASTLIIINGVSASDCAGKIVCYYNSQAYQREYQAKVTAEDLKPALPSCDYLVYGYIGINKDTFVPESLDKELDLQSGKSYFKTVTALKKSFPHLKVLLSIGGFRDYKNPDKYIKLLRDERHIGKFVTSLKEMLHHYDFDGVDLAWQFPLKKEINEYSVTGIIWEYIKKYALFFLYDVNPEITKKGFSSLCKELSAGLKKENLTLFVSVLPHVKFTEYIDTDAIKPHVDYVHLMTFNYRTPERSLGLADFAAPLYYADGRDPEQNIQATVGWWRNNFPGEKLILGIPTYGRSWQLNYFSHSSSNKPPVFAEGPGSGGKYLAVKGTRAYYEMCLSVTDDEELAISSDQLLRVYDKTDCYQGVYAYRSATSLFKKGIWISYEDPETVKQKAVYAFKKHLGGIAIVDLTLDDFKGLCVGGGVKYPLLNFAKTHFCSEKIVQQMPPISDATKKASEFEITTKTATSAITEIILTTTYSDVNIPDKIIDFPVPTTPDQLQSLIDPRMSGGDTVDKIREATKSIISPDGISQKAGDLMDKIQTKGGTKDVLNPEIAAEKVGDMAEKLKNGTKDILNPEIAAEKVGDMVEKLKNGTKDISDPSVGIQKVEDGVEKLKNATKDILTPQTGSSKIQDVLDKIHNVSVTPPKIEETVGKIKDALNPQMQGKVGETVDKIRDLSPLKGFLGG